MKALRLFFVLTVLLAAAFAGNILPNPSFELWLGNMPVGWLTSEPLYPGSALPDSNSHSGSLCVKLTGGDTSAFMSSATLVRAGYHYRFSGFARVPGALGGSFVLQFLSLAGGAVGSPELLPVYYSGTSYREYSRWITAPDSAVFLAVAFATLPGVQVFVDDVTVDDTTLVGVSEPEPVVSRSGRIAVRKVVRAGSDAVLPAASRSREWFDLLGRRVLEPTRAGVLFARDRR